MDYKSLDADRKEFRLLRLRSRSYQPPPSQEESELKGINVFCELEHAFRGDCDSYTALSYAWGDMNINNLQPVFVSGAIIKVSFNLGAALRELRNEQNDLLLWVDQICIDQNNIAEREEQVQQMQEIYTMSARVVAWIGPAADDSDMIIAHLTSIGERAEKVWNMHLFGRVYEAAIQHAFMEVLPILADRKALGIMSKASTKFLQREYWKRLWIIQEFAVAPRVDVLCGGQLIRDTTLTTALNCILSVIYYLEDHGVKGTGHNLATSGHTIIEAYMPILSASKFVREVTSRRSDYRKSKFISRENTLFHNVVSTSVTRDNTGNHECTDPRDRIFAVLGLALDAVCFDKFPDYRSSVENVYTELAMKLLKNGPIDILAYCVRTEPRSMQSWVPDWRMAGLEPNSYSPWRNNLAFLASGRKKFEGDVNFITGRMLSIKTAVVDTVMAFGDVWSPDRRGKLDPEATLRYLSEIRGFCAQSERTKSDEVDSNTSKIAIANFERAGHSEYSLDFELKSYQQVRTTFTGGGDHTTDSSNGVRFDNFTRYCNLMRRLRPCRPFISATGYVGLAPPHVETGDKVVVFLGGLVPYIIHPSGPDTHTLVGEAYVHGVMFGEHMEGNPKIETLILE